jgi:sulfate permease, SulP family
MFCPKDKTFQQILRKWARFVFEAVKSYLPSSKDYNLKFFRQDLLAGLTVAVVALPLALGFGITSGAGAAAGLYTAIVAGVIAAIFGGSSLQVSGPTGAMTAILLPIVARYGVQALPVLGTMAGLLLLVLAFTRIGRYVNYIPWPVVTGFTNGIAVIIFLQQLPYFLGVKKGEGESILTVSWHTLQDFFREPGFGPMVLGLLTIGVMLFWLRNKRLQAIPASMAALVIVTLVSLLPFFTDVPRIGEIPRSLPSPSLPLLDVGVFTDLFRAALAVAALSALESLLCAVVADGMTVDQKHNPDRELFGQGLANIATSLFGGIPATAALARTAVNVRSGARTRLAAITHGVVLLAVVLFLAPLASVIPLAVLGGILMVVAARMVEREAVRLIWRSTKSDAFVLVLTTVITIVFDLILAIEVGLIAAGILFIVRMSNMFQVNPEDLANVSAPHQESTEQGKAEEALLKKHIVAYRIDGPIFFGAANRFFDQLLKTDDKIKVVILRMRRVPVMDATGATALMTMMERLERRKILVFISGLQEQPKQLLTRMGVLGEISHDQHHLFETTEEAIAHAYRHLEQQDHTKPTKGNEMIKTYYKPW